MRTKNPKLNSNFSLFAAVLLLISVSIGYAGTPAVSETPTTLKDAYKDYFKIGVAINRLIATGATGQRADNANRTPELLAKDIALVKKHFNSIVAENDLKPSLIHPNRGSEGYVFDYSDAFVKFGEENDMYITGHTLIWHSQVPGWFFQGTAEEGTSSVISFGPQVFGQAAPPAPEAGGAGTRGARGGRGGGAGFGGGMPGGGMGRGNTGPRATREELIATMRDHIHTVVGRYKGKVKVWDVVNEALGDSDAANMLRSTQWTQIIGEDFIAMAFKFAHEADPDAILRYNDYSLENKGRRDKLKKLVKQLQDQGVPIHAIGTQTHISASTTFEQIDEELTDLETIGLPIHVTELDMNVSTRGQRSTGANVADNASVTGGPVINEADRVQAEAYTNLFRALIKHKDSVDLVVFWGINDAVSWRASGRPLLFDGEDNPKPAFDAVMKVAIEAKKNGN
jgi:endo-1,4-beta-xylanase